MNEMIAQGFYAPFIITGIVMFIGGVVMLRLSRIRRDYDVALDMPALTSSQWWWMAIFCFFSVGRNLLELTFNLFAKYTYDMPRALLCVMLGMASLALFESGRKYFSARVGLWIYIPLLGVFLYAATLAPQEFEYHVRMFMLAPACLITTLSILRRLHALNISAPQVRTWAWILAVYGVMSGLVFPSSVRFAQADPTSYWQSSDTLFIVQMLGAVLAVVGVSFLMDHYGVVRDRYFDGTTKRKRQRFRRAFLLVMGMLLILGITFADTHGLVAVTQLNARITEVVVDAAGRFVNLNESVLPERLHGLCENNIFITHARVFLRDNDRWEAVDELGNRSHFPAFEPTLQRVSATGAVQSTRNLQTVFAPLIQDDGTVRAILSAEIDKNYLKYAMNSERLKLILGTFVVICLIAMMWLGYAGSQERKVLVSNAVQQFNQLFKESQTIEMLLDPRTGTIIEANLYADHFFCHPPGGLKRKRFEDLNLMQVDPAQKRAENVVVDYMHKRPNGETSYLQLRMWPIHFQGASLEFCLFSDQSAFVREGMKLQGSLDELQSLFDAIPVPVYLKNGDGYYLLCNDLFAKFFGQKKSRIIGHHTTDLLAPEHAQEVTDADDRARALPEGQPMVTHECITSMNGKRSNVIYSRTRFSWQGDANAILGTLIIPEFLESCGNVEKKTSVS